MQDEIRLWCPMPQTENNIYRAQQMMLQLRKNYLLELPEQVDELEQRVLGLAHAVDFVQAFEELYRKTHSLKGTAGTYGMQIISVICHQFEESLERIEGDRSNVDDDFVDRCIACIDLMRLAIEGAVQGKTSFGGIERALALLCAEQAGQLLTGLLVESSRFNAALYRGTLKNLPINFTVVESGFDALGLLLHKPYDLLITGYETTLAKRSVVDCGATIKSWSQSGYRSDLDFGFE